MKAETTLVLAVLGMLLVFGLVWYVQAQASQPVMEEGSIEVVMCPACKQLFVSTVEGGGQIDCALYDDGKEVGSVLKAARAQVITDDETHPYYGKPYVHSGLMHNKFCSINGSAVLVGSYNPTDGGERNRNNQLLIRSRTLASNYEAEFNYLKSGERGRVRHVVVVNGTRIENYFCPADSCEQHVLDALGKANSSIKFMTYSFTSDPIGQLLLDKRAEGVQVEGVCDGGQLNDYTECTKLGAALYKRPELLHHKVFIIDSQVVVTGSYNPTSSGNERNDENVLVIYSPEIAQQYLEEYDAVKAIAAG